MRFFHNCTHTMSVVTKWLPLIETKIITIGPPPWNICIFQFMPELMSASKYSFFFWKKCSIYVRRHKISDNILNRNIVNYVCRHEISAFWLRNLSIYNLRLNCCLKNNTRMILFQKSRECIIQRETNRLIAPDRR